MRRPSGVPRHVAGVQTLTRGLDVLERVTREPMRASEVADRAGLSRATASRLVAGLISQGLLTVGPSGRLRAGPKLLELGFLAQRQVTPIEVAQPELEALSERTGLTTFLAHRDGDHSVHLFRRSGRERLTISTPVGARRRLAETSLGKALILDDDEGSWRRLFAEAGSPHADEGWEARMRESAAEGVVLHHGPPPDRLRAVAAPVRDAGGGIVAAINVASLAQYMDVARMEALVPDVRESAAAISRALGWRPVREEDG